MPPSALCTLGSAGAAGRYASFDDPAGIVDQLDARLEDGGFTIGVATNLRLDAHKQSRRLTLTTRNLVYNAGVARY